MDGTATLVGTHEELLARSPLYRDLVGYWAPEEPEGAGTDAIVVGQPAPVL
jgi:ATP-binding cassette subfamily C protein